MSTDAQAQITCRELVDVVSDYLEGQIAAVQKHAIDAHLGDCPGCDEYVRQMRLTIAALHDLTGDEVMFPQTREDLVRAFGELRPAPQAPPG